MQQRMSLEGSKRLSTNQKEEQAIKPPSYDFEKMIEEAMQKHGEAPAV